MKHLRYLWLFTIWIASALLGPLQPQLVFAQSRSSTPEIRAAYSDPAGNLIIAFSPDPKTFPAGNTYFFGKSPGLFQIEISSSHTAEATAENPEESSVDVFDPKMPNRSADLHVISGLKATLSCRKLQHGFRHMSKAQIESLQDQMHKGQLRLHFLPPVHNPLYFFQVKGKKEYILVTEPRFNFYRDYRIYLVSLERKQTNTREIPIEPVPLPSRDRPAGTINFTSGGGIYIPMAIDLFSTRATNRGSPTLIRDSTAPIEELTTPDRKLSEFKTLKPFFSSTNSTVEVPSVCQSMMSQR